LIVEDTFFSPLADGHEPDGGAVAVDVGVDVGVDVVGGVVGWVVEPPLA